MSWRTPPEPIPEEEIIETMEADVVVIGLGYSGHTAARAAAEAGASVIGLESASREHQMLFGRDVGHINSKFLKSRGIDPVDPIDLFNEWARRAGNRINPGLVMQYAQNCGDAFDWYTDMYTLEELNAVHVAYAPDGSENLRAELKNNGSAQVNGYYFWFGTAQFPDRFGWPGGPELADVGKANIAKAEKAGAQLFWKQEAVQLIKEGNRVTGVIAKERAGSAYRRYLARKCVILAAGDFCGDPEMLAELCPDLADLLVPGEKLPKCFGRKGGGQKMGVWAGGRLETRPLPVLCGNMINFNGPAKFGSLWLNREGNRFCNEVFGGTELRGFPGNQAGRGDMYLVFDEHILENELTWAYPGHDNTDINGAGVKEGLVQLTEEAHAGKTEIKIQLPPPGRDVVTCYAGRTPEELCDNAGLTGQLRENVIRNIARYNEICEKGRDDDFGRDPKVLDPLTDMLFLQKAKPSLLQVMVTVGGFVTDEKQQVLDLNYDRIEGLYATGNCCGRRFGMQYATPISGVSIGMAITLGREVGKTAAAL